MNQNVPEIQPDSPDVRPDASTIHPVQPAPSAVGQPQPITGDYNPPYDYIVRATALDGAVRAFACRTTQTCQEALRVHQLAPIAAVALGRLMTGVLLMTQQDLKDDNDSITAIIRGDGPLGGMTVIGQGDATVRGYCQHPVIETVYKRPGKMDVGRAVGSGTLTILKDHGLTEPYVGRVELVSGEIAEDLTYYLAVSEQIPTIVSLGVLITADGIKEAGGMVVQLMPDAGDDIATYLENRISGFPEVTFLMQEGFTPQQILDLLIGDPDIIYHTVTPCRYVCHCSRERMERNLLALGPHELHDLAQDPAGINLECHFCSENYYFTQQQVRNLLHEMTDQPVQTAQWTQA